MISTLLCRKFPAAFNQAYVQLLRNLDAGGVDVLENPGDWVDEILEEKAWFIPLDQARTAAMDWLQSIKQQSYASDNGPPSWVCPICMDESCGCSEESQLKQLRLERCRENLCGHYEHGDRCVRAPFRPCQLVANIRQGFHCQHGFHSDVTLEHDPSPLLGPWITYEQLRKDVADFAAELSVYDFGSIAGVPRSGLMVASEIAIRLGLPLYCIGDNGTVKTLGGLRVRHKEVRGPMLVVEDSTASGRSIEEAKRQVPDPSAKFAAVYATHTERVDFFYKRLPLPHWFEWNLFGNNFLLRGMRVGSDFDGILCRDFTAEEDDDGDLYYDTLQSMRIKIASNCHIPKIITGRLEKYREPTIRWLRQHGITWDDLIMFPGTYEERSRVCMGSWKAEQCNKTRVGMYIESCRVQAEIISRNRPGYVVLCPELGKSIIS